MKFRALMLLLTVASAGSSTVMAHDRGCNNSTIRGSYAFTIHGQILLPNGAPPIVIDGLARTTFDGNGNATQLDAVADNGNVDPSWRPNTGTYSLNRDCTGTMTVSNGDRAPVHVLLIVSQSGNTIRDMVIDPGFATTAEGERIEAPDGDDRH